MSGWHGPAEGQDSDWRERDDRVRLAYEAFPLDTPDEWGDDFVPRRRSCRESQAPVKWVTGMVETKHAGRRPAVVVTRPRKLPLLPVVIVAVATTTIRELDAEVVLKKSDGVPKKCALNLETPELIPKGDAG